MRWRSLRRKECSLKPPGMSITFDCEGPVQAEIFVVELVRNALTGDRCANGN